MCAKACLRVDLECVLDHFEFKMYQSKRKINFAMYQSKKNNFTMLSEKILQCIRENFTMYQSKLKKNFKMYQSKLNFLRCIKAS